MMLRSSYTFSFFLSTAHQEIEACTTPSLSTIAVQLIAEGGAGAEVDIKVLAGAVTSWAFSFIILLIALILCADGSVGPDDR
jgi:hypothetical protein